MKAKVSFASWWDLRCLQILMCRFSVFCRLYHVAFVETAIKTVICFIISCFLLYVNGWYETQIVRKISIFSSLEFGTNFRYFTIVKFCKFIEIYISIKKSFHRNANWKIHIFMAIQFFLEVYILVDNKI